MRVKNNRLRAIGLGKDGLATTNHRVYLARLRESRCEHVKTARDLDANVAKIRAELGLTDGLDDGLDDDG